MPFDLTAFLENTREVDVPFAGDVVKLTIWTAGMNRLTKEQRAPILKLAREHELHKDDPDRDGYGEAVEYARVTVPLLVQSWDVLWRGQPLPVADLNATDDNAGVIVRRYDVPDELLFAIGNVMREIADARPTQGETSPSSTEQTVAASPDQTVN